jgi:hypothetical protein
MSGSVQQTPNTGGVAPAEGAAAQGQSPAEAAIAGMRSGAESAKRVQTMSKVAFVRIVDVGGKNDQAAVEKAASENRESIKSLREAVKANAALSAKLEEKSVKPESVVAARLNDDGSLTIYIDKSAASH